MRRSVVRSLAAFIIVSLLGWGVGKSSSAPISLRAFKLPAAAPPKLATKLARSTAVARVARVASLSIAGMKDGTTQPDKASVVIVSNSTSAPTRYPLTTTVDLTGSNTQFSAGATTANFGPGIAVGDGGFGQAGFIEVRSSTSATAQVTIDKSAAPGPRVVIVNTGQHKSVATFVVPPNPTVPVAHAGVLGSVVVGKTVYLDGTGSTIESIPAAAPESTQPNATPGQGLAFHWTLVGAPNGSSVSLANENSPQPSLVPDLPGDYLVQLTVSDGTSSTSTWLVLSTNNTAPVADAGPDQFTAVGEVVRLNGSGSTDLDGDALSYQWNLVSAPATSSTALSNSADVSPTFTVDVDGDYLFRLDVDDGHGNTSSDTVLISTVRSSPTAVAAPAQKVALSQLVEFDGSASSEPTGKPITCAWRLLSKPSSSNAQLSHAGASACSVRPSLTADRLGMYVVQLIVSDPAGHQAFATTSTSTDQVPPIANPGLSGTVGIGDTVALDGSRSTDPGGGSLTYVWSLLSKPLNSAAVLSQALSAQPEFVADEPGNYVAQLIVFNGTFASTPQTVLISAQPAGLEADSAPALGVNAGGFIPSRPPRPTRSQLVQISPSSISFNDQLVGTTSSGATVSVSNPRSNTLSISDVQLVGASSGDFAFAPLTTSLTVPANGSASISMTFRPSARGARSAALRITDDTGQHDVSLYGNGIAPEISLAPASVEFDKQLVSTASQPVPMQITNTGTAPLVISSLSITGASSGDFSLTGAATPLMIQPQQSATIKVTFTPNTAADQSAVLTMADNTPEGSHSAPLTGTGVAPAISITPATVAFGNQLNGTQSAPLTLTINNTGTADLVVSSLTITGTNAADFALSAVPTLPLTIKPAQNAALGFVFTPGSTGSRAASLTITHNATSNPLNVGLSGTGTAPGITPNPSAISFGDQQVGTQSSTQNLIVTNSGTASLIVSGMAITGANSADFSFASGFTPPTQATPITVAAGNSTTVPLAFMPTAEGPRSGTVAITGNANANVTLSGKGTAPAISVAPTTLMFGNQPNGSPSAPLTLTITNTGTADLLVSSLTISGANAADFSLSGSPTLPLTIKPGQNAALGCVFTPGSTGSRIASLTIAHNATGNPLNVALSGTGTAPAITPNPTAVSFGDQLVGNQSATQILTITNSGSAPLIMNGLTITSINGNDFSFPTGYTPPTQASPVTVAPEHSAAILLTFKPSAEGTRSGTLAITGNASASVTLSGTGVAPAISITPATVAFGNQLIGSPSASLKLTINNPGTADLVISSVAISGTNAADFALSTPPTFPLTIKPGQNAGLDFVFTPASTGSRTASLAITHNAAGSPLNVAFTGAGTAPAITPSPSAISFGDQLVGSQSPSQPLTITNSGTAPLIINGLTITGGDFLFASGFVPPTQASPLTIATGNSSAIPLTFKPTAEGTRSGTLAITGNASATVGLSGNGTAPHIGLSTTSIQFNTQQVESTSTPTTITLTNVGTAPLTVSEVSLTGANPADFALGAITTPFTVAPNTTANVTVTFRPTMLGPRSAQISITSSASGSPSLINLTGTGTGVPPQITPSSINFGDQVVGTTSSGSTVSINNPHSTPLSVSSLQLLGANPGDFAFAPTTTTFTVPAQGSAAVVVKFTPSALGARSATLRIVDNTGTTDVTLAGNGTAPAISVTPTTLAFGNQLNGTPSDPLTITLNNPGTADLVISSLTISGANASDFALSAPPTLPLTIKPGQNAALTFVFTPATAGSRTASLVVVHNASGSPLNLMLSGTGTAPAITPTPAAISFGDQLVGTQSSAQNFTITNSGTALLIINGITITGTNSADFSFASGFTAPTQATPITVASGSSTSVPLTFRPSATGTRSGTLMIAGNASAGVPLSGTGTAPTISVAPVALVFGSQLTGTSSGPLMLTITNTGTADLILSGASITGANASDFALSAPPTLPLTIKPGQNTALTFVFTPSDTGSLTASLSITHNATGSPLNVAFSGTGTAPGITPNPSAVTFGDQLLGTQSATQALTVTNSGTAPLIINGVTITGTNSADFGFASAFTPPTQANPITVTPGNFTTIPLTFKPSGQGTRSGTLAIIGNASANVTLSGTGVAPAISVTPTTVSFGNQLNGTPSDPLTINITNTGTADLVVSSLTITGANASDFALSAPPTLPLTVQSGHSAALSFVFTPANIGSRTALLAIAHNAIGSPFNVAFSGTGTAPGITTNLSVISFADQLVGTQSPTQSVTLTNSGTATLTINGVAITGANSADFSFAAGFTPPTQAAPITVGPGNSTTVPLTFKPTAEGTRSGTIAITGNASANVSLTGNGIAPAISLVPAALAFGNQPKGVSSAPIALAINNTGTGDLLISNLVITGPNAADFTLSVAPTYPIVIPAGTSGNVAIVFTPTTAASETASLMVTSNAPLTTVPLSGTGTVAQITFSPATTLAFGDQLLNTSSAPATVSISNPGSADLRITNIGISGSNAGDFALTQAPMYPIVVAPNGFTSIGVIFSPKTLSTETATLSFTDNVAGGPQMLSMTGMGVAPAIGPLSPLNFGSVNVGASSSPMTLTVTNPGTSPLHITSLSFGGTNAADFSTSTTAPIVVDPNNGTVTISLSFAPTAVGQRNGTLLITDDAMGSPHSAALSGVGVGVPKFSVDPLSLDFGSIADGSTTPPQPLTIANIGSADLVIDHLIKTGADAGDFSYSVVGTHNNDFPATVTPGSNLTVNVFFTPSEPGGTRAATLVFQDASNTSLGSVGVSGVGIAAVPQISLSKTSLTFPPTPTTISSAPLGIVVTNNGTKDLTISALTFTGTNAGDFSVTPVAPVVVPKSGGTATLNVRFKPTALGSRSATLAITNDAGNTIHEDTVTLSGTGRDLGRLSLQPATVGKDLELLAIGSVDVAPSADLSITITSSDPTKLLLSPLSTDPNGVNAGLASFVGILPKGKGVFGNGFPAFWIQALASSGTAQITMTAPGYTSTTATITLTPSGFVLASTLGVGSNFTTQLNAADSNLTVNTAQLGSGNSVVVTNQKVRGGLDVSIDIANDTPATGTLSGTPVSIPSGSGSSVSGAVKFHPVAIGTTVLSIIQPSGYSTPASGSQLTATVQSPSISLTPTLVGYNLEVFGFGSVNIPAPAGGLQVTLTSSDPGKVLLATDPTALGSSSITLTIPAGSTTLPIYYIQGLGSSGTATVTATATGYSDGVANVGLNPSGFVINSQNSLGQFTAGDFVTTTISAPNPLQVSIWQLDSLLRPVVIGQLRGGISAAVQVVSGTPTTGTILDGSVTFHGGDSAQNGMLFEPNSSCLSPCTSALSVTHTMDYVTPASGGTITATVTMPAIAIRVTETTVGINLQVEGSGALDVPAPVDLPVTITSNNPNVLVSASPADQGSQTLNLTVPAGSGLNSIGFPPYYIQSLSDTGSAQLTISTPGFSPSTATVTLAPAGFVIEGPNGIGNDFGVLLNSGNVALTIRAAVLNPTTLNPTVIYQAVRGGFVAAVDVTSSAPNVATIVGTPVVVPSGNQSGTVTLQPLSAGQANVAISAPAGYTAPASGNHFSVTVN